MIATEYGGWANKKVVTFFTRYCETMFQRFAGKVKYWMTFNEINAALELPFKGSALAFSEDPEYETKKHQALYHQFLASAMVTQQLHHMDPSASMGCMIASFTTYPETCHPEDIYQAMLENRAYYLYLDVQADGQYSNWYWKQLERKGIQIETSPQELQMIKENTID